MNKHSIPVAALMVLGTATAVTAAPARNVEARFAIENDLQVNVPTKGTSLDLSQLGDSIAGVNLSDQSRLVYKQMGSYIVLKPIEALDFPGTISSGDGRAILRVFMQSGQLLQFDVGPGSGTQSTRINVVPSHSINDSDPLPQSIPTTTADADSGSVPTASGPSTTPLIAQLEPEVVEVPAESSTGSPASDSPEAESEISSTASDPVEVEPEAKSAIDPEAVDEPEVLEVEPQEVELQEVELQEEELQEEEPKEFPIVEPEAVEPEAKSDRKGPDSTKESPQVDDVASEAEPPAEASSEEFPVETEEVEPELPPESSSEVESEESEGEPTLAPIQVKSEFTKLPSFLYPTSPEESPEPEPVQTKSVQPEDSQPPEPDVVLVANPSQSQLNHHSQANAIVRGLLVAHHRGELKYRTRDYWRAQTGVKLLRLNPKMTLADISKRSGLDVKVYENLIKMGTKNS